MAGEVFASDARNNCEDIATTISSSYDKAYEAKFSYQTLTSFFGMEPDYVNLAVVKN